jgi:hypothetical protein
MEYCIIEETSTSNLVDTVNMFCESGWEPQGGIVCVLLFNAKSQIYLQAMVREAAYAKREEDK